MATRNDEKSSDWELQGSLSRSISSIETICRSNIFSSDGMRSPLFEAAVVQVLICLNDMLQKVSSQGRRINFNDDVGAVVGKEADVTSLINACRNAACHISSPNQKLATNTLAFNVFAGHVPNAMKIGDVVLGCDYDDDIAINYGPMRVYLKRHVWRAFEEARKILGM